MIARAMRLAATWLLILQPVAAATAHAQPASPVWFPGFPMRAGNAVILMWTPVPGATAYRLVKKTGAGEFGEIYRGPGTSFTDPQVPQSATVLYKVSAIADGKESPPSPAARLKGAEVLKPPAVTGALSSAAAIVLRWSSPPGTVFSNIYRAESERGPYERLASVQQDSYSDSKVEKGKTYFYKVAAVDEWSRESARSPAVLARLEEKAGTGEEGKPAVRKVVRRGEFFGEEVRRFNQPSELGVTGDGILYVMDRRSIQFLDTDGKYLRRIDFDGKWSLPGSVALDRDGDFLVTFHAEGLVRKIARDGLLVAEIRYPRLRDESAPKGAAHDNAAGKAPAGGPAVADPDAGTRANNPNAIAVDGNGNYWIADGIRCQVINVDREGKQLAVVGRPPAEYRRRGLAASDLPAVKKIWFNPRDGLLYALLGVSAEIKVIEPRTARVLRTVAGLGASNAKFQGIGGLAFREDGGILVLDSLMRTVKEFDAEFRYVATYADVVERDRVFLSSNVGTALAFDGRRTRFYVASTLGNRVYAFDIPD